MHKHYVIGLGFRVLGLGVRVALGCRLCACANIKSSPLAELQTEQTHLGGVSHSTEQVVDKSINELRSGCRPTNNIDMCGHLGAEQFDTSCGARTHRCGARAHAKSLRESLCGRRMGFTCVARSRTETLNKTSKTLNKTCVVAGLQPFPQHVFQLVHLFLSRCDGHVMSTSSPTRRVSLITREKEGGANTSTATVCLPPIAPWGADGQC